MAESCRIAPVVYKRNGVKIEEKGSKLYKDIKEAVKDRELAWEMWAFTKTSTFKSKFKDLEHDELGEVTFPSLIKVLGLEEAYNEEKSSDAVARDYGVKDRIFGTSDEAASMQTDINANEKKYIAVLEKVPEGYKINILPRIAANVQIARQQSYNHALTGEIINLMRSMGFDVSFVTDPKFEGLFDPRNAKLEEGLLNVIQIARGELGEQALPEEFSHLMIEGLIAHPLVQRLLNTIDESQIQDVLGENYDSYYEQYGGDMARLKKETAGKLLAQHIKGQGTISKATIQPKRSLLSRIWNWAKGLFSRVKRSQIDSARERAYIAVADVYNVIASGEAVNLIDRSSILNAEELYKLSSEYSTAEQIANKGLTTNAKLLQLERMNSANGKVNKDFYKMHMKIRKAHEEGNTDSQIQSMSFFLKDTNRRLSALITETEELYKKEKEGTLSGMDKIREIAKINRKIIDISGGYREILGILQTLNEEDNIAQLKIDKEQGNIISEDADKCVKLMNSLEQFVHTTSLNMLYEVSRTVYSEDKIRGIGSKRNEVMSLKEILEHADRDINFVDRWLTALSDADDPLLTIFDGLVKNQQYERDMEMIELNARIAKLDNDLKKAGYTSDFMYELDENGVPTQRIISIYDWDTYNKERFEKIEELRKWQKENNISNKEYFNALNRWMTGTNKDGQRRTIRVYVNPEYDELYKKNKKNKIPADAVWETMPNPAIYSKKADTINNLAPAQREYYEKMMDIKREMMMKLPHRGQAIYRAPSISKDFIEGVLDNSTGNVAKATLEQYKKKFIRRPDDIGFGASENFPQDVLDILKREKDPMKAAEEIIHTLAAQTDEDVFSVLYPKKIKRTIEKHGDNLEDAQKEILDNIAAENFYLVDTDFANHKIQRLPIYYTRPLKDKKMLSTDFSGVMVAYSAMATNYDKMNEVVDILEVGRTYVKEQRAFRINDGKGPLYSKFQAFGKLYKGFVERAGSGTNTAGRLDDYMSSVVYEERKEDEGTWEVLSVNVDVAKTLDAIKDYTGLLGLGFNIFSTMSNIAMGKIQQWIESVGGEYFTVKDYMKACAQYSSLIPGCVAEMGNPLKKNKLSLLIQMFDPMGDYFENLRDAHFGKSAVSQILGNGALAYIGMNAGEHLLHCQTMLAILNNIKLIDKNGKRISLYDALEVKEVDGITKLVLKEGLSYKKDIIDNTGNPKNNRNYGKPVLDENGKIKTETIGLKDLSDNATQRYIMKKKRIIRKVNDSLNGAFSVNDKGAIHKKAVGRLIMQFRQWMPAHYERRFARAHYDNDLEQWREGYYITVAKTMSQIAKDLKKGQIELVKLYGSLSEHEQANLRRAEAEISLFFMMMTLIKIGGRVKDRDRSWLDKMALYQIHRMYLELGASMPSNIFFSNIFQLLQSPAASINNFEKFGKVLQVWNAFDEVQTGRYQGWSEWGRDIFQLTPAVPQLWKAIDFDDSMFSMYEQD